MTYLYTVSLPDAYTTFEGRLLGVLVIGDLCEIFMRFSFFGPLFLCILSVESLDESFKRSFISWIVVDILYEKGRCSSDFLTRISRSLSWLSFHY